MRRPNDPKYEQPLPMDWRQVQELFEYGASLVAEAEADVKAGRQPKLERRKLRPEECRRLGLPEGTMEWKIPAAVVVSLSKSFMCPCRGRDDLHPCDAPCDANGSHWKPISDWGIRMMDGSRKIQDQPMCRRCRGQ